VYVPDPVGRALDVALDRSLAIEQPVVHAYVERVRSKRPGARPDEVIAHLERQYRRAVTGIGAAAGSAAAVPGIGTGAALASGMAEVVAFVSATAMYVLALAELHDIPTHDPHVRRELVMAVLLGEGSAAAIEASRAGGGAHWAHVISSTGSTNAAGGHGGWSKLLVLRFGARQSALYLGRAVPMGIGAGIGAVGNAALARGAIASARRAFGPPPTRLPGRVIEGGAW
jgi:hypothetical protein